MCTNSDRCKEVKQELLRRAEIFKNPLAKEWALACAQKCYCRTKRTPEERAQWYDRHLDQLIEDVSNNIGYAITCIPEEGKRRYAWRLLLARYVWVTPDKAWGELHKWQKNKRRMYPIMDLHGEQAVLTLSVDRFQCNKKGEPIDWFPLSKEDEAK